VRGAVATSLRSSQAVGIAAEPADNARSNAGVVAPWRRGPSVACLATSRSTRPGPLCAVTAEAGAGHARGDGATRWLRNDETPHYEVRRRRGVAANAPTDRMGLGAVLRLARLRRAVHKCLRLVGSGCIVDGWLATRVFSKARARGLAQRTRPRIPVGLRTNTGSTVQWARPAVTTTSGRPSTLTPSVRIFPTCRFCYPSLHFNGATINCGIHLACHAQCAGRGRHRRLRVVPLL
jgi:hypothetical protein